jgi:hypothetical protein
MDGAACLFEFAQVCLLGRLAHKFFSPPINDGMGFVRDTSKMAIFEGLLSKISIVSGRH